MGDLKFPRIPLQAEPPADPGGDGGGAVRGRGPEPRPEVWDPPHPPGLRHRPAAAGTARLSPVAAALGVGEGRCRCCWGAWPEVGEGRPLPPSPSTPPPPSPR
ncbi:atherin-like [Poecile atricapillus]|uniref:atherin-like n=1 Tax=Poecile atricapillus TaxID=48891 RepID=UPI00273961E2|nr:atherin-like [Poecile atricapillus]